MELETFSRETRGHTSKGPILSTADLKRLGEEGFFVGPREGETTFIERVRLLRLFYTAPHTYLESAPLLDIVKEEEWRSPIEKIEKAMGCSPRWIVAHYSNRNLLPWQGAVSEIYALKNARIAVVQLHRRLKKGRYLLASREEVLRHEAFHAIRSGYPESGFEELFAHFLSGQKWRIFLGPLFRNSVEVLLFFSALLASFFSPFFFDHSLSVWIFLLPSSLIALLSLRLWRDRGILRKVLGKIARLFPSAPSPFSIACRLTDAEMRLFAQRSAAELLSYIEKAAHTLRWRQILAQFSL